MKIRFRNEKHDWSTDGPKINDPDVLSRIKNILNESPIIVEHWLYMGSSAPEREIFDDYEIFEKYLNESCYAGDDIWVWDFGKLCMDQNALEHGKCPDDEGKVPKGGAY